MWGVRAERTEGDVTTVAENESADAYGDDAMAAVAFAKEAVGVA
jgi:hypothetical protein